MYTYRKRLQQELADHYDIQPHIARKLAEMIEILVNDECDSCAAIVEYWGSMHDNFMPASIAQVIRERKATR